MSFARITITRKGIRQDYTYFLQFAAWIKTKLQFFSLSIPTLEELDVHCTLLYFHRAFFNWSVSLLGVQYYPWIVVSLCTSSFNFLSTDSAKLNSSPKKKWWSIYFPAFLIVFNS